jgi:hypothetical protein
MMTERNAEVESKCKLSQSSAHAPLILWLAYEEAKAMIQFDAGTPPKAQTDKN